MSVFRRCRIHDHDRCPYPDRCECWCHPTPPRPSRTYGIVSALFLAAVTLAAIIIVVGSWEGTL